MKDFISFSPISSDCGLVYLKCSSLATSCEFEDCILTVIGIWINDTGGQFKVLKYLMFCVITKFC